MDTNSTSNSSLNCNFGDNKHSINMIKNDNNIFNSSSNIRLEEINLIPQSIVPNSKNSSSSNDENNNGTNTIKSIFSIFNNRSNVFSKTPDFLSIIDNLPMFLYSDSSSQQSNFGTTVSTNGNFENDIRKYGKEDISVPELLKQEGIKVRVTSTFRPNAKTKLGRSSWHSKKDELGNSMATDIVPIDGDFNKLAKLMASNPRIRAYFATHNLGILNETTKEMLARTGGTGPHFHIGPDSNARAWWKLITAPFQSYSSTSNSNSASILYSNPNFRRDVKNFSITRDYPAANPRNLPSKPALFSSKSDFARKMYSLYCRELDKLGMSREYAKLMIALDMFESGEKGDSTLARNGYNYGGIGYKGHNVYSVFSSPQEYVYAKLRMLTNSKFKLLTINPHDPYNAMMVLNNRGYCPDNKVGYSKAVTQIYNSLKI